MNNRTDNMECRLSEQAADEAGYWDARLRAPDCSDADRARFANWRDASPEHREAFERLQTIVASLRHHMARADVRALRDTALSAEKLPSPRRRLFATAAAIACLATLTALWLTEADRLRVGSFSDLMATVGDLVGSPRSGIYETGTGQRSTTTLQDGSSVELNARTRIKVVFGENTRRVELLYGQALFHVAHDTRRPFIVRAADREITAVGTQFDVRLDATSVRVTLIEGKVKVSRERALASSALENSAASLATGNAGDLIYPSVSVLTPGEQFVAPLPGVIEPTGIRSPSVARWPEGRDVTPEGTSVVRMVDVTKVTGWRDGRIFLDDQPLEDAIAEMNRHSPVQITLTNPALAQLRVNGMFRAGEQDAFVTALKQYFPIDAERRGDTDIILTRRQ